MGGDPLGKQSKKMQKPIQKMIGHGACGHRTPAVYSSACQEAPAKTVLPSGAVCVVPRSTLAPGGS